MAPRPSTSESSAYPEVLPVEILAQPDGVSCGPTCLHAVYRYWGEDVSLDQVIASAGSLDQLGPGQGTLSVMLGLDALRRGYQASLHTYNLHVFDPTWFDGHGRAASSALLEKLTAQASAKSSREPRFRLASDAYVEFVERGGVIRFRDLTKRLIVRFIRDGKPVLTGLSATYLYHCRREIDDDYDDIRGEPVGHFVVLHGYSADDRCVHVADPLAGNPGFDSHLYTVPIARLLPAIMLGVLTYDANLLVLEPRRSTTADHQPAREALP